MNVLIVCAGNTCRSPMAAGLLARIAQDRGMPVSIRSAGLAALDGERVSPQAVEVMRELSVDISDGHAQSVTEVDVAWAAIVVGLNRSHLEYLADQYPSFAARFLWIGSDVTDPYFGALAVYRETRDELERLLFENAGKIFAR